MADGESHPQPGDLIEIDRSLYKHWALYVGDGYVIHVTDEGAPSLSASISLTCTKRAKVKKELLKHVAGKNKWRVNNKYDRSLTPLPVEEILRNAEQLIDKEVPYGVLSNNCEHFVTELRYGKAVSDQVTKATSNATNILGTVAAVALTILVNVAIRI